MEKRVPYKAQWIFLPFDKVFQLGKIFQSKMKLYASGIFFIWVYVRKTDALVLLEKLLLLQYRMLRTCACLTEIKKKCIPIKCVCERER